MNEKQDIYPRRKSPKKANIESNDKLVYLMFDGNLYKIGQSKSPMNRLRQLKTANPRCELICFGNGVSEKFLHIMFDKFRIEREWFELNNKQIEKIQELLQSRSNEKVLKVDNNTSLSDIDKLRIIEGKNKTRHISQDYVFTFGKYKGRKLSTMESEEEIGYCLWLYDEMKKSLSKNDKKKLKKYKALSYFSRNIKIN